MRNTSSSQKLGSNSSRLLPFAAPLSHNGPLNSNVELLRQKSSESQRVPIDNSVLVEKEISSNVILVKDGLIDQVGKRA